MLDLHVHTNASDGEHSPAKVVEIAKLSDTTTIAITDHDTCSGVKEAICEGRKSGIEVIPGIEVTAYENEEIHVLGYFVDYTSSKLNDYFELIQKYLRNEEDIIFKNFERMGFSVSREEIVNKYSKDEPIAPGHFVDWLYDNDYERNKKEAYIKYFQRGALRHRKSDRMKVKEAISFIRSIDGIPVLAHPSRISWDINKLARNVNELTNYGLMGIEAIYSMSSEKQIKEYIKIAENNNLLITLGSDYHGHKVKDYIDIGTGEDNSLVKYQNEDTSQKILGRIKEKILMVS